MPFARGEIEEAKLEECPETPRKKDLRSDPKEEEPSTPKKTKKKRKASPKVADSKPEEAAVSTEWQLVVRGEDTFNYSPRRLTAQSKKVKVGTDCSGMDTPLIALENLGIKYDHIFSCEHDKYARRTIQANHMPVIGSSRRTIDMCCLIDSSNRSTFFICS